MSTSLVTNKKRGANIDRLPSVMMQQWCLEMIADVQMSPMNAAKKAGYKNPAQSAYRLMRDKRVQAILGKEKREREDRTRLTADDVLEYIHFAVNYNPLEHFRPLNGKWMIVDPDTLPHKVGRMIDSMELKVTERKGENGETETESYFIVKLIKKEVVLTLAAKHHGLLEERGFKTPEQSLDWDAMLDGGKPIDIIDSKVEEIEG